MPVMTIRVRSGRTPERKRALMEALKNALTEAFEIADNGWYVWLEEYRPENSLLPGGEENSVNVEIQCFYGRSPEQKEQFYRLAAKALAAVGEEPEKLVVALHEPPLRDWGLGGVSALRFFTK